MKGWKKYSQKIGSGSNWVLLFLISEKTDAKLKLVRRDREGLAILIEGLINRENVTASNSIS